MKHPEEVKLSREEGEALIERLEGNALTADDRRVLAQVLRSVFLAAVCLARGQVPPQTAAGYAVWREA